MPQREAIKAAKGVLQNVTSLVLIEEMANIKALAVMAKRIGEATTYVYFLSLFPLFFLSSFITILHSPLHAKICLFVFFRPFIGLKRKRSVCIALYEFNVKYQSISPPFSIFYLLSYLHSLPNFSVRRIQEATTLEAAEYPIMEVERVSEELIKRVSV